jgi:hypothetical protein
MTAKDKAIELYRMYNNLIVEQVIEMKPTYLLMTHEMAKKSALIAVEQVRFFNDALFYINEGSLFDLYLDDVKREIENL